MCEHNLLSSGYVAPLLNFHSPDSLYLQNLRGTGVHLSGLPQMSYSRREVCSLPWSSPNSCTIPSQSRAYSGYSQPFFSNSAAVSASLNTYKKGSLEESGRYYFQDVSHKSEEPGRPNVAYTSEQRITGSASNEVSNSERRQQNRVAQNELNFIEQPVTGASTQSVGPNAPFQPSLNTQTVRSAFSDGLPWCPSQVMTSSIQDTFLMETQVHQTLLSENDYLPTTYEMSFNIETEYFAMYIHLPKTCMQNLYVWCFFFFFNCGKIIIPKL
ncbi:homeobox protein Hox-D12a isoform X1 [Cyprinus carpio]|uniref:Homeobox D12a n=2 Tax=Cyprinus carpio TaxID=7962 RepID=A0A9J8CSE5_CYPCA|nr:homeobox protein Hox-D12a isoform X1 [Cyprinus carpio]